MFHVASELAQASLGRDFKGQRFGPRPLDLDIIFYNNQQMQNDRLQIPHPRWQERDFVKAPLADLFSPEEDLSQGPCQGLAEPLLVVHQLWQAQTGDHTNTHSNNFQRSCWVCVCHKSRFDRLACLVCSGQGGRKKCWTP